MPWLFITKRFNTGRNLKEQNTTFLWKDENVLNLDQ